MTSAAPAPARGYAGAAAGRGAAPGVRPALDLGCLLGCGAGLLGCIYCGINPACWLACAGPQAIGCVTKCL